MATPIDVVVFKCRKIVRREIAEIVRYLLDQKTKFWLPLKLSLLRGSRPKSNRAIPNNVLTVFQISPKSVHCRRSYGRTREHRFCPVEYFHDSPGAILRFGRIIIAVDC